MPDEAGTKNIFLNSWRKRNKFTFIFTVVLENKWFKITQTRKLSSLEK